jgi:hypothetical protein
MNLVEHQVTIRGTAIRENGADPAAAGSVLSRLDESLRGAVDVAFRRSSASGRRQRWLRQAAAVQLKETRHHGGGAMTFHFLAPAFEEVAQDYYSQSKLFDDGPNKNDTAFDILADAVGDVLAGREDSDRYDVGLLRRFHRFQTMVFGKGIDELLMSGHRLLGDQSCRLSPDFPRCAQKLYLKTPEPAQVRVAGRLDIIQASTLAFVLLLPGGEQVPGVWKGDDFETLRALANSDVVASGTAVYRPSGRLLRVDAERLAPQRPSDRFFATVPSATGARLDLNSLVREQRKRGGMAAIYGQIPAHESDEEFLAAVTSMD